MPVSGAPAGFGPCAPLVVATATGPCKLLPEARVIASRCGARNAAQPNAEADAARLRPETMASCDQVQRVLTRAE